MTKAKQTNLISIWAGYFLLLAIGLCIAMPVLIWTLSTPLVNLGNYGAMAILGERELALPKRLMGLSITMLPITFLLIALYNLRRVFGEIAKGQAFSDANTRALHMVGLAGCAMILAQAIAWPLMSLAMSYDFPAGERIFSISLGASPGGLLGFFAALMFLVLAQILQEAKRNAQDLAMIV